MPTETVEDLIRAGLADFGAGRMQAAAARFRQALARSPNDANALHLLGLALHQLGRSTEALDLVRRAIRERPDLPPFWFTLAGVQSSLGADADAVASLTTATRLAPDYADAFVNLAMALYRLGRLDESANALRQVVRLRPTDADRHAQLGQLLWMADHWGDAEAALRRALVLRPDHRQARQDLAAVLTCLRQHAESIVEFRRLLADPSVKMAPGYHSNFLLDLLYIDTPPAEVLTESKAWATTHAALLPPLPSLPPVHVSGRRVRVGYVSPDLRDHPVGRLIAPLLAGHHRDDFEVHCYSDWAGAADPVHQRLRRLAEQWHPTAGLSDEAVAQQVRQDGIDLLIDLAGHTAHHRLLALARRPAPVQATYLGYPATTGLPAIDYRLTDAVADPPGLTDAAHTERLVRLPGCFICFDPPTDAPDIVAPPAASTGHITFGSFNTTAKIAPSTIRLWAEVLTAVPTAKLLLKSTGVRDGKTRDALLADLAAAGVDPARVHVLPREATFAHHLARYGQVDIALDTFPYNGTMTTLDALWMGVPTITLAGPTHVSRVGLTLVTHADLPGFAADTPTGCAAIAARWAADVPTLATLRRTMRDRLRSSPLTDGTTFVAGVESAFAAMLRTPV